MMMGRTNGKDPTMFTTYRSRTTNRIRNLPSATKRAYCSRLTWITELVRMKAAA